MGLDEALLRVRLSVAPPVKVAVNPEYGYSYAREIDWYSTLKEALDKESLLVWFSITRVQDLGTTPSGRQRLVRVRAHMTVAHVPTGQTRTVVSWGEGADPGDKAVYKAITGAKKYGYAVLFGLPTTDDPEAFVSGEPTENGASATTPALPTGGKAKGKPQTTPRTVPTVPTDRVLAAIAEVKQAQQLTAYWRRAKEVVVPEDHPRVLDAMAQKLAECIAADIAKDVKLKAVWLEALRDYDWLGKERVRPMIAGLRA